MPAPKYWQNLNTNLGFVQTGRNAGEGLAIGARGGYPTLHNWKGIRSRLANSGDPDYVGWWDDLIGKAASVNYTFTGEASSDGSLTPTSPTVAGGVGLLVTSPTSPATNDYSNIALGLNWSAANGWVFADFRVRGVSSNLTAVNVELGLTDALTYTGGLAWTSPTVPTPSSGINSAIFAWSTATATWKALASNAGTVTVNRTHATALLDATNWHKFSIAIRSDGHAFFFVDDVLLTSYVTGAAIVAATALTPYISVKTTGNAQRSIQIDYLSVYATR